jgi:hypothetical protein
MRFEMRHGHIHAALLTAICLAGFASSGVSAQQQSVRSTFRTPWGEPDLQGIWASETLTPMERPARFANKPILTPEEAKQLADDVHSRPGHDDRSQRGAEKEVARAYNEFFIPRRKPSWMGVRR